MENNNFKQVEEIRKTFNQHSERYESWFSEKQGKLIKETEKRAVERLIPKGSGLEAGVGSGIFASALGIDYGIDPAEELVQIARSREVKTVLGIAEMLPFREKSFEYLLFMFTISFLKNPLKAFQEAYRALKPKGELIVCFITKESPWGKYYRKKKAENHNFYKHAQFHTTSKIIKLLKSSGFRKTKSLSTLFQKPNSVKKVEDPINGTHKSAGLCCFKAIKN